MRICRDNLWQGIKELFFYFLIYSFFGWVLDTIVGSFEQGYLFFGGMFRSFSIPVPIAPIYGVGGLTLILFYRFLKKQSYIIIALFSGVLITSVEYLGSLWMVVVLHRRAWDYSEYRFNLNGHIELWHSFGWLFLGVIFIKFVYPWTKEFLNKINLVPKQI